MRLLPIALCGSWLPWQPKAEQWWVNGTGTASLCSHCAPALHCHSLWTLQGDLIPAGSPRALRCIPAHQPCPPAHGGATRHLCTLYPLDLPDSPRLARWGHQKLTAQGQNVPEGLWWQTKLPYCPWEDGRRWLEHLAHLSVCQRRGSSFPPGTQGEGRQEGEVSLQGRWASSQCHDGSRAQTKIPGDL